VLAIALRWLIAMQAAIHHGARLNGTHIICSSAPSTGHENLALLPAGAPLPAPLMMAT